MSQMEKNRVGAARSFEKAIAAFEAALNGSDYHPVIALQLAGEASLARAVVSEDRNFDPATGYFQRVVAADPSFLPAFTELAKIGLEREDYPFSRSALTEADALSPSHPFLNYVRREYDLRLSRLVETQSNAVSEAVSDGEAAEAMAAVEQLARIDPELAEVFNLRAIAGYYFGDLAAARDALRSYIRREGESLHSMTMLGQMQLELRSFREAWETLSVTLGYAEHLPKAEDMAGPTTPLVPYSDVRGRSFASAARAVALFEMGEHDRALTEASEAAPGFPAGGICLLDCAETQRLAGRTDAARSLAQAALDAVELPLPEQLKRNARSFLSGAAGSLLTRAKAR
jgi:tetratricopeptide (TPR) repeat protein